MTAHARHVLGCTFWFAVVPGAWVGFLVAVVAGAVR